MLYKFNIKKQKILNSLIISIKNNLIKMENEYELYKYSINNIFNNIFVELTKANIIDNDLLLDDLLHKNNINKTNETFDIRSIILYESNICYVFLIVDVNDYLVNNTYIQVISLMDYPSVALKH